MSPHRHARVGGIQAFMGLLDSRWSLPSTAIGRSRLMCCPGKDECRVRMDALERPSRDTSTSLDCLFRTQSTSSILGVVCVGGGNDLFRGLTISVQGCYTSNND
jgi:hypothetical protein